MTVVRMILLLLLLLCRGRLLLRRLEDPGRRSRCFGRLLRNGRIALATLIAPIAMEEGLRFAIREGGRTVGAGVVAKIIE